MFLNYNSLTSSGQQRWTLISSIPFLFHKSSVSTQRPDINDFQAMLCVSTRRQQNTTDVIRWLRLVSQSLTVPSPEGADIYGVPPQKKT